MEPSSCERESEDTVLPSTAEMEQPRRTEADPYFKGLNAIGLPPPHCSVDIQVAAYNDMSRISGHLAQKHSGG